MNKIDLERILEVCTEEGKQARIIVQTNHRETVLTVRKLITLNDSAITFYDLKGDISAQSISNIVRAYACERKNGEKNGDGRE